ncbi:hypothetical protein PLICRDRAFT_178259 [Plicaturopsis crispa FD-325 SS-3]|nr:hypothetical protein PLICRDRAFT_178259 [Plicaturopsis crispa FD-325 SS-3]
MISSGFPRPPPPRGRRAPMRRGTVREQALPTRAATTPGLEETLPQVGENEAELEATIPHLEATKQQDEATTPQLEATKPEPEATATIPHLKLTAPALNVPREEHTDTNPRTQAQTTPNTDAETIAQAHPDTALPQAPADVPALWTLDSADAGLCAPPPAPAVRTSPLPSASIDLAPPAASTDLHNDVSSGEDNVTPSYDSFSASDVMHGQDGLSHGNGDGLLHPARAKIADCLTASPAGLGCAEDLPEACLLLKADVPADVDVDEHETHSVHEHDSTNAGERKRDSKTDGDTEDDGHNDKDDEDDGTDRSPRALADVAIRLNLRTPVRKDTLDPSAVDVDVPVPERVVVVLTQGVAWTRLSPGGSRLGYSPGAGPRYDLLGSPGTLHVEGASLAQGSPLAQHDVDEDSACDDEDLARASSPLEIPVGGGQAEVGVSCW